MSVRTLRTTVPPTGSLVALHNVVVVGRIAAISAGELWVQDAGGGRSSGILIFCDYSGTIRPCAYDSTTFKQFRRGQVVDIVGVFHKRTPKGASSMAQQLRIESPNVTVTSATMEPVATTVMASEIAKDQLGPGVDPLKGSYVRVVAAMTVASTSPREFQNACASGDAGASTAVRYVGFEAATGGTVLAVGLNFFQTVGFCLNDPCPGASRTCTNPITNQTFKTVQGVVEPHFESTTGDTFLRLSPTVDADLQP